MKLSQEKQCENICSKCGSRNIDWGLTEVCESYTEQHWTCKDCGTEGLEYCNLVYMSTAHYV